MADTKKPDAPEKSELTVLGGDPAPKEQTAPYIPPKEPEQAPSMDGEAPVSNVNIPEQPAPGKTVIDFNSIDRNGDKGKVTATPDKAAPEAGGGDSLDQWNKEQAALDAKKKPSSRSRQPAADKTVKPGKADKPATQRKKQPRQQREPDPADLPPWEKPMEEKPATRRGRPKKAEQAAPAQKEPEAPAPPIVPREAPRSAEPEQIVFLSLSELHEFKDHPFGVRDDAEMQALVESVKEKGVNQPALVRPRPDGGYEIIAGHRRQKASELAGFVDMPCIVRNMTDDEAVLAMTDDNLRQRSEILPSERAVSLKMQVEAIKHQGAPASGQNVQKDAGQRSVDVVAERNGTSAKQVQRYMRLTELVPELMQKVDEKKLSLTAACEISFVRRKNQSFISVALDSQQNSPNLSQAQKMRELDQKGQLNNDTIDGILCQEKKEVDKVIISGEELNKYFGKEKTPREMKDQIIKLLDDWSAKDKTHEKPERNTGKEK